MNRKMVVTRTRLSFFSGVFTLLLTIVPSAVGFAEITLDGSLGPRGSLTGPNYMIGSDLGQQRGGNLFHSFGQFNVFTGESATFSGPASVQNVISRITGGNPSSIDGAIKSTIPGANLFFLNPSGVMFGPNASVDVGGSLHVSTADLLRLSDGGVFFANLSQTSVLTSAPPSAFGFLSMTPAPISIQQSGLQVTPGKTLSFVGGDFSYSGDPKAGYLYAPGGRVNLVSVASPGEVNLSDFSTGSFAKMGNITITNIQGLNVQGANIDTDPAGTIVIRGGKISFKDSTIRARGNPGGTLSIVGEGLQLSNTFVNTATRGAINHPGTAVDIHMSGDVVLSNASEIASSSFGTGRSGGISISADNVILGDDNPSASSSFFGDIGSRAFSSGRAGDVEITAGSLVVKGGFFVGSRTVSSGDGGNVTVHAGTVEVRDMGYMDASALIAPSATLAGNAGTLTINADNVLLSGKNAVLNSLTGLTTQTQGPGGAGTLRITAETLQVLDGARILATVVDSPGKGAVLEVNAKLVVVSGTNSFGTAARISGSLIGALATGRGSDIRLTTDSLLVTKGGAIRTQLLEGAPGEAGSIYISAGNVEISDRGFISASAVSGTGTAGTLDIRASGLSITGIKNTSNPVGAADFTGLSTSTNVGGGGNLVVKANTVYLNDQGVISASTIGAGKGGNIELNANTLSMSGGSLITATSTGAGYAGNISINGANTVTMKDSFMTTEATVSDGGNIQIHAQDMVQLVDSVISSSVGGGPQTVGGNITIDPHYVVLNDSRIIANAFEGKGGNIKIVADVFISSPESIVDASSAKGIDGIVDIQAAIKSITGPLVPIQGNFLTDEALLRDRCAARIRGEKQSSLVVGSRDGIPSRPGNVLPSPMSY